ncbi:MAG: hypothetical protein DBW62_00660 [Microbacterium sp.]|nr:MAG: hypothetical protein DBW62_00660 [Microbacterium sp.]
MATVKSDLEGTVLAVNAINQYVTLAAGDTIPEGYFVGGHAVEGGDEDDQTPPWRVPTSPASAVGIALLTAEDADAAIAALGGTSVGAAVFTSVDEAAARTAIGAAAEV